MGDYTFEAGMEEGLSSPIHQLSGLKSCVLWTSHVKGWCFQPHSLLQWGSWGYHTWSEVWPITPDLPKSWFYLFFLLADTSPSFCPNQTWAFQLLMLPILVTCLEEKTQLSAKAISLQALAGTRVLSPLILLVL